MNRCTQCSASIPDPSDLDAVTVQCGYCGNQQPVANLLERQRLSLEKQREQRLAQAAQDEAQRQLRSEQAQVVERKEQRRESKRGRWGSRLLMLIPLLTAPTIIAITVFDLPARLGYGSSGSGRLETISQQLTQSGCTVLVPIESEYTKSNVSKLFPAAAGCMRVFAAGGGDHSTLGLRLYGTDGKQLASADDTSDPQLSYCAPAAGTLRFEVRVGPASSGRLSHMVLSCPAEDPKVPAPPSKPARPHK
jgi:hypothetical protein